VLLQERDELVVHRLDGLLPPGRMGKAVHPPADQVLEVLQLVDVRGDAKPVLVRLVDDGADHLGRHLAAPRVVPDLDPAVHPVGGELLNALACLRLGGHEVHGVAELARGSGVGRRDAGPGCVEPRHVGRRGAAPLVAEVVDELARIGPEAQHGRDAVVGELLQVLLELRLREAGGQRAALGVVLEIA